METVSKVEDIWVLPMLDDDVQAGIDYGIISRAWTYDRMGAQARGDFGKAIFRIAVGRAVQSALERHLAKKGVEFHRNATDYKEEDYWDLKTLDGKSVDLKSFHVFTDYAVEGRPDLTAERIVGSSTGESWSAFFPMLIPKDQLEGDPKDYYIFAIVAAPSSKRFPDTRPNARFLLTLPYDKDREINNRLKAVHRRKFAHHRVEAGETFSMTIERVNSLLAPSVTVVVGYGDVLGSACRCDLNLERAKSYRLDGLTSLHYIRAVGDWVQRSSRGRPEPLLNVIFHDFDEYHTSLRWKIYDRSFEDVWIYDARVFFAGWIGHDEFVAKRSEYRAYAPNERYDGNTYHRDPNERGLLTRKSFCYFYPPVFRGGTQNFNYYCLPQDLHSMDSVITLFQ